MAPASDAGERDYLDTIDALESDLTARVQAAEVAALRQAAEVCEQVHNDTVEWGFPAMQCWKRIIELIPTDGQTTLDKRLAQERLEEAELWNFHCDANTGENFLRWRVARLTKLRAASGEPGANKT